MGKITFRTLKGTRDFLPSQYIHRRKVVELIQQTFEQFGFEPMETPAIEYAETLEEKYGEEGERLIYKFTDQGGRKIALRYDLTVPLARTMAMYQVEKPFRRYQISPVWRADRPQKGRFREFWQCDADIIGTQEMWADAEIIALTYCTLRRLGFEGFTIRINNRKLLNGIAIYGGIEDRQMGSFFRVLDKTEQVGWGGVKRELENKGFSRPSIEKTMAMIKREEAKEENILDQLRDILKHVPVAQEGIEELKEIDNVLNYMGIDRKYLRFDISLVRGLDYYTGPIFETVVKKLGIGSISGGGRFDTLISKFSGKDIPATGTSLGLERIIAIMEELHMLPIVSTLSEVLVTVFNRSLVNVSFEVVSELRSAGINAEIYLSENRLKKQLNYANNKGIPLVVIIGPDENKKAEIGLRDMRRKTQLKVSRSDMIQKIKQTLGSNQNKKI